MNTPLRAALALLTGATMLLVAACSSTTADSTSPSTASATASAWVKPLESGSYSVSPPSGAESAPSEVRSGSVASSGGVGVTTSAGQTFVAAPLPAGLTAAQLDDARMALSVAQAYWRLADQIGANPSADWADEIGQTATGAAADGLEQSVTLLRQDGMRGIGTTSINVSVTRVEAGAVYLAAFVDVSGHDFVNAAGDSYNAQKDPGSLSRFRAESQVGEYQSGWKITTNVTRTSTSC